MIPLLIISAYAIVWLTAARKAATWLAGTGEFDQSDPVERILSTGVCTLVAVVWPLALPVWFVMATRRPSDRELRQRLAERDERIAELERELGVGR